MTPVKGKILLHSSPGKIFKASSQFLQFGIMALVWISMPFAIGSFNGPIYLVGIAASIGIFSQTLVRIPLMFYTDRVGRGNIPSISLIVSGLSLITLSLSSNFLTYSIGFAILGFSSAMVTPLTGTRESGVTIYKPLNDIYSLRMPATLGIFIILLLSSIYSGSIDSLYAILSLVTLFWGLIGLITNIRDPEGSANKTTRIRLMKFIKGGANYLRSFDELNNRRLTYLILITDLGIFISIAMTVPFLSSLGSFDHYSRSFIFIIFGIFAAGGFLVDTYGRVLQVKGITNILYFIRPMIILIAFLLLSVSRDPSVFVSGVVFVYLWLFSDRISSGVYPSTLDLGDARKIPKMEMTFQVPISFLVPLIASLLWYISPRTLFAFALVPVSVSVALAFVIEERFWSGQNFKGHLSKDTH